MFTKGDFHLHTNASDGGYSPSQVVKIALDNKYNIISITDHDTLEGLDEAIESGNSQGVKVIPGIELSTRHNNENIHLLGYFKNESYKDPSLKDFLQDMKNSRYERAKMIIQNLKKYFNIDVDYNKMLKSSKGIIARPHIAKAILDAGYNYSWEYIFKNILSEDSKAYVPTKKISTKDGIDILKKSEALVVLAHPVLIKNSTLDEMLQFPFDGLEAIYPLNSKDDEHNLKLISKKYEKFITAGSDFHGIDSKDNTHGKLGDISLTGPALQNFLTIYFS
ncbi:PHP domain-containing protein [Haloimpatiens sp. FM7315]|uniref:PHP domain-containing protein n=1 Tax=Haloimpatiens sp. FM7315 TaxID=3298609 RepID=UPI0035A2DFE3